MKARFDQNVTARNFIPGDKVSVLLPLSGEPLLAKFRRPYLVEKQLSDVNYVVGTHDRWNPHQVCHINMLKRYYGRDAELGRPVGLAELVGHINHQYTDS